ncbi:DUF2231 domain-containing protein [Oryzobacter telluris]|uniref:DUF2231 domain-containing protein n=1 Tax=Oryzobacter telluris TaxID=3149179 RepID=UPI00370D629F
MFDTVTGLPVHVLVVHAIVVLGPLAGLTAIVYAVRPGWRVLLRWPLVVVSALAAVTAFVATQSGEALEHRLESLGVGDTVRAAIHEHSERGELARNIAFVVVVLAVAAAFWALVPGTEAPGGRPVALVAAALLVVAGLALVVATVLAGHSGSSAVWSEIGKVEVTDGPR